MAGVPGGSSWSGRVRTVALRVYLVFTRGLFPMQMMMQYLYHGGTESMDIPTADILEVRSRLVRSALGAWCPPVHISPCTPCLRLSSRRHLPALNPSLSIWRDEEGRKVASLSSLIFPISKWHGHLLRLKT